MKRKWLFALLFVYLIVVSSVAIMTSTLNNWLILTMPEGDAILLIVVMIGGVVVVGIEIWNLRRNQKRLFAEKRHLEETIAHQTDAMREREGMIASQTNTIREQKGIIDEQQDFRSALNHALKNPITAIKIGLERLSDDRDRSAVARLKTDADRVFDIFEKVNILAQIETQPLKFGSVRLDEVIPQAVDTVSVTPAAADCKFEVDLPKGPFLLPAIQGDDNLLFIVLLNLLDNAVKFSPNNCEVIIRAFEDGGYVVVQVSDKGMGIRQEDLDKIWNPFFRGQEAHDRKIPGSGMGLYQVHKIVARHAGQISIRSMVGEGTEVTIRLPVGDITNS
jgi:two-component system, OmpR family, sensor kinase